MVDNGSVVPVIAAAVDVIWLPAVTSRTIFDVESDYRRYHEVNNDDWDLSADLPDEMIDYSDDIFSQEEIWKDCWWILHYSRDPPCSLQVLARQLMTEPTGFGFRFHRPCTGSS